jgi:hypothetical protein
MLCISQQTMVFWKYFKQIQTYLLETLKVNLLRRSVGWLCVLGLWHSPYYGAV